MGTCEHIYKKLGGYPQNTHRNTHRNKKRIVEISQEERGEEETHVPTR
jgi:hypothetical protein